MSSKRIALVGYPSDYFHSFARALEQSDFEVFWIHSSRSAAKDHAKMLSPRAGQILDTTLGFEPTQCTVETARRELTTLETNGTPRVHDIILMDRILRRKNDRFALCYLNHLRKALTAFLVSNSIELVSSGRDTALQLISMLVCRKLGIPWVVPTRMRIPQEMYMFASGHETASIVRVGAATLEHRAWATRFLEGFNTGSSKPLFKAAATNFTDVLKMLPKHARLFWSLANAAVTDSGNDYSRYTLVRIIDMYATRRANLLRFKLSPPYSEPGTEPFCLYALHTQPESSIDVAGSYFSDQIALITVIARSLPVSHELYVKIHPTDVDGKSLSFYRRIAGLPGVRLINYDVNSRDLIDRASIIFALTGTAGYEAALLGKNVVAFARNFYNGLPTVRYCSSPTDLPGLVNSLLCTELPADWKERVIDFLADLKAQAFEGEVNRMYQPNAEPLNARDLRNLRTAYETVYNVLCSKTGLSDQPRVAASRPQLT